MNARSAAAVQRFRLVKYEHAREKVDDTRRETTGGGYLVAEGILLRTN